MLTKMWNLNVCVSGFTRGLYLYGDDKFHVSLHISSDLFYLDTLVYYKLGTFLMVSFSFYSSSVSFYMTVFSSTSRICAHKHVMTFLWL